MHRDLAGQVVHLKIGDVAYVKALPTIPAFYCQLIGHLEALGASVCLRYPKGRPRIFDHVLRRDFFSQNLRRLHCRGLRRHPPVHLFYHTHGRHHRHVHLKIAYLPRYFYYDRSGYSGWAEIAQRRPSLEGLDRQVLLDQFYAQQQRYQAERRSKYAQPAQAYSTWKRPGRPFVFLPTQLPHDKVMHWADVAMVDLIAAAVRQVPAAGFALIIKRHPMCQDPAISRQLEKAAAQPHVQLVDANIHDLLAECAAVLTVNSGVGFEALLYEKPVFAFGHSDYHWATRRMRTLEALDQLPDVLRRPHHEQTAFDPRMFVAYFLRHYLIELDHADSYVNAIRRVKTASWPTV